ncbi:phosphatidylinositol mannoside acyltransferase [Corynebacterium otitidis]
MVDWQAAGYLAGWRLVRLVPEPAVRAACRIAARVISRGGRGMPQLRRNLSRVVGPANVTRRLVTEAVYSYARYWAEAFRLPALARREDFQERLGRMVVGRERFEASLGEGRGVVLVLPHTGNWDMAGALLVHDYESFTTVAERLKPESLFQAFVDYRESLGFRVLPLTGSEPPMPRLVETLEAGGVVCLLGERDLKARGVKVEFFGEECTMPVGAAELARRTGAALHVVHSWFEGDDAWGISVSERVPAPRDADVAAIQQRIADLFAANISRHPADWHMLQPLWPADVPLNRQERRDREAAKKRRRAEEEG